MNNKGNLVIIILVIAVAVLAWLFMADGGSQQVINSGNDQNQAITEPPPPDPASEKFADNYWLLTSVTLDGAKLDMPMNVPKPLTLNFTKATDSYGGFSGCNSFSGKYVASANSGFTFGATAATKMYCMETSALESSIFSAMGQAAKFSVSQQGSLTLTSADGKTKLEYKPAV